MRCHLCDLVFDNTRLFGHMRMHGLIGDDENDEATLQYMADVNVVVTYRECLRMMVEKLRQAYHSFAMRMVLNGLPRVVVPSFDVDYGNATSSFEMFYVTGVMQLPVTELPNSVIERSGFPYWRSLPN